jgi:2,4-dienoyl-CoA reductase (NADPH2)
MQGNENKSRKEIWEFKLGGIEDLKRLSTQLNIPIDAIEDVSILAEPIQVGRLFVPNSLVIHPMEGADGDSQGRPGKLTLRRYERFAAGGAGLIWVEATTIICEGRANPRQLWLNEQNKEDFVALVKLIKHSAKQSGLKQQPIIVLQLTHSGRYSKPEGVMHPLIVQRDPYRDAFVPQQKPDSSAKSKLPNDWPILTDEYLDGIIDVYVNATRLAFEAGFDAVDIKSCHGYLINELLSSRTREGKYGGSFENRTRFLLDVIDRIHNELGEDKMVVSRLGVYDAIPYPYGWGVREDDYTKPDLTEPKKLIALLEKHGVKMINITVANPYYNPHYVRPFNEPIIGGYQSPEHPLAGVSRLISLAGEIQKEFGNIAIVGTGYSWLRTLMPNVAAASKANGLAALVGVGRMAFAYPDFAKDIINKGKLDPNNVCTCCSGCIQIMRDGGVIGCVVRDSKIYGPIYRNGRRQQKNK